jgi:hypothetical protein
VKGKYNLGVIVLLACSTFAAAQNYNAIHGSNYAGSLGVGNNPASILNTPYPWDITVLGVQEKHTTNAVTIFKYSLLSSPANSEYLFTGGDYARYVRQQFNVNLLNARFALNRQSAIAFGVNIRAYTGLKTSAYNFIDTLHGVRDFFNLGNENRPHSGDMTSSSWAELYGTYSRTLWDRVTTRLNAGVTLKVSRGLAGAHAAVSDVRATRKVHDNEQYFEFQNANARYGYSHNFDKWNNDRSTSQNLRDFLAYTSGGMTLDFGVEYLIKSGDMPAWDEDNYYDYEWKIGLSLLDIGFNQYKYGQYSRQVNGVRPAMADSLVDERMNGISGFEGFTDSLASMVNVSRRLQGDFNIINPARMVINVDRYLFDAFYINADLTVNLSSVAGNRLRVRETNLLTITPRWETRIFGVYMPLMVNTEGRLWVGGAFKAGPLLLGIHNWANVFSKTKMQHGGGYLALVIRPWKKTVTDRVDKRYDCPSQ